jgi:hypothetical protein
MHRRPINTSTKATTEDDESSMARRRRRRRHRRATRKRSIWDLASQDILILLFQLLSYLIIVSCFVILIANWIFGFNIIKGNDAETSTNSRRINHHSMFRNDQTHEKFSSNEERIKKEFDFLKPSPVYSIPDTMPHIGDKSDQYASLRKEFDAKVLPEVSKRFIFDPFNMEHTNSDQVSYDIYDCPDTPPDGYPFDWNLIDVLKNWPPDDPTPRPKIYQGLCVFDYEKDFDKAMTYRKSEVPFIVVNDPQVQETVKRWNAPEYMESMLGKVNHRTEYSVNNHFMYWNNPSRRKKKRRLAAPPGWSQPTQMMRMPYQEWLTHANQTDDSELGPDKPHWYYRLIGCGETGPNGECDKGSSEYLFDELPFFQPKPSLYLVKPELQKGIHCRFGMKGVIAENHFDGSRNSIAVLGGERRYILSHPDQCKNLALLPKGHPSARHSAVDWSDPDLVTYPEFQLAKGNEVVLQAGDVLYLPTNWFHYIISLNLNFQCNTRSGASDEYKLPINECGF